MATSQSDSVIRVRPPQDSLALFRMALPRSVTNVDAAHPGGSLAHVGRHRAAADRRGQRDGRRAPIGDRGARGARPVVRHDDRASVTLHADVNVGASARRAALSGAASTRARCACCMTPVARCSLPAALTRAGAELVAARPPAWLARRATVIGSSSQKAGKRTRREECKARSAHHCPIALQLHQQAAVLDDVDAGAREPLRRRVVADAELEPDRRRLLGDDVVDVRVDVPRAAEDVDHVHVARHVGTPCGTPAAPRISVTSG